MRALAVISGLLTLSSLGADQGQIVVNNRIGSVVVAPIARANGAPPLPGATVQVMLVKADGTLVPIEPTTHFRIETPILEAHYYFWGITPVIPGVLPEEEATFRVRAWEGPDWASATARGESSDVTLVVGGGRHAPPNLLMSGFTLFPRITVTLPVPEFPAVATSLRHLSAPEMVVEESQDLRAWKALFVRPTSGGSVSFDVFASAQCRFYRLTPR